ncbi:MAG: F0F1 ATP synthase subunit B [Patescibacteria group bacterium]
MANLGIDWKLLLAQAINFLVLLFILRRFAYKPMLDFLEKRSVRIEQGLKDAEAAQQKLAEMEAKEKETLSVARSEARAIVDAAEASAKKRDVERLAETETKTKRFLEDARVKIDEEKQKILAEARKEIAEVVTLSVEKILREKVDEKPDKRIIEMHIR